MNDQLLNPDQARQTFLAMVINRAYEGSIRTMAAYLENDWPAKRVPADVADLRAWFATLNENDRELVRAIIRKTADSSVFGFLVLLDSLTGGYPLPDKPSDFAVYLQTYKSDELRWAGTVETSIRLNDPRDPEFLHDLFHALIEET